MQTKRFCSLIEAAILEISSEPAEFITVPYYDEQKDEVFQCLGIPLTTKQIKMAEVAARAMYAIYTYEQEIDVDEMMDDFIAIISSVQVAPYMQWHCAYFPGLTEDEGDRNSTEVLGGRDNGSPIPLELPELTEQARLDVNAVFQIVWEKHDNGELPDDLYRKIADCIEANPSLLAAEALEFSADTIAQGLINRLS